MARLSSKPAFTVAGLVEPPLLFGFKQGFERRCVPIPPGARVSGEISGTGLGGSDWQRIWPDGTTELEAHYAIRTDEGHLIEVVSTGLRSGKPEVMQALLRGEAVDPSELYFRSMMRLTTDAPQLHRFTQRLFVGVGRREPDRVSVDAYALD